MKYEAFRDAVDGIFAYDTGATDSGIQDEALRAQVAKVLAGPDAMAWLSRYAREAFLSDAALAQGYSIEDVSALIQWLSDRMEFDL